jgi:uncharacterized protein (DUF433 family)
MPVAKPEIAAQKLIDVPLYSPWDAAHYLHLPAWTVIALSGRGRPHPEWFLLHAWRKWHHFDAINETSIPDFEEFPRLSFRRIAELFVRGFATQAILQLGQAGEWKKDYWLRIHEMVWMVFEPYPEAESFFSEGYAETTINNYVERFSSRVPTIQPDWLRKLILRRLERVDVHAGVPMRLYPFSREPADDSPRLIELNPQIRFGHPTVVGRGVPTDVMVERFRAGDSSAELADDYGISTSEVEEAIRYETLLTTPLFPPFFGL